MLRWSVRATRCCWHPCRSRHGPTPVLRRIRDLSPATVLLSSVRGAAAFRSLREIGALPSIMQTRIMLAGIIQGQFVVEATYGVGDSLDADTRGRGAGARRAPANRDPPRKPAHHRRGCTPGAACRLARAAIAPRDRSSRGRRRCRTCARSVGRAREARAGLVPRPRLLARSCPSSLWAW